MRMLRRVLLLAVFVGLFVVAWHFTRGNEGEVVINLLALESPPVPIWLALLLAFGAGAGLTAGVLSWSLAKKSLLARRYRRAVSGLESEIHELRSLPLAGEDAPRDPEEARAPDGRPLRSA